MSLNSHALYQHLLLDVSYFLSEEQINQKEIWPDANLEQRACHSLIRAFYKKFVDIVDPGADAAALDKFRDRKSVV